MILTGSLGLGVQLKQEALAKRFGVSRIPVREALKRLQAEGLVQHTPHQGSIVATQFVPELLETLDIRIGLETRALKLAIPLMKTADHKAAREIMARYDASDSPLEWAELNLEFHLCLYRACGRPRLLKMIEEIVRGIGIHLRAQQSYKAGRKSPHPNTARSSRLAWLVTIPWPSNCWRSTSNTRKERFRTIDPRARR